MAIWMTIKKSTSIYHHHATAAGRKSKKIKIDLRSVF